MTQRQRKQRSAHYLKFVEWSEEDQCFIGRCPGLFGGAVHGPDEAKVYKELCETVEEWIEILERDGTPFPARTAVKKFSGKFVLRVDPALHQRLTLKAQAAGESLNSYCAKALVKA